MNIAVLIATLGRGGAEGVVCRLANEWVHAGHQMTIVTYVNRGATSALFLDPRVNVTQLSLILQKSSDVPAPSIPPIRQALRRLCKIRSLIRLLAPDAVAAFTTKINIIAIAATRGLGIPVVVSERSHPEAFGTGHIRSAARSLFYPFADAIVAQSTSLAKAFDRVTGKTLDAIVIQN